MAEATYSLCSLCEGSVLHTKHMSYLDQGRRALSVVCHRDSHNHKQQLALWLNLANAGDFVQVLILFVKQASSDKGYLLSTY